MIHLLRLERERDGDFALAAIGETGSKDSHHGVRVAIDGNCGTEYVRVGAKLHPVLMGKDDDMVFARLSFFRQKIAAHRESVSQHATEPGSVDSPLDELGLLVSGNVEIAVRPGVHVLKCGGLPLPIEEVSGGYSVALALDFQPDDDQLVGFVVWQWREQGGVIDCENGCSGTDAYRQGQHHHEGVAGK